MAQGAGSVRSIAAEGGFNIQDSRFQVQDYCPKGKGRREGQCVGFTKKQELGVPPKAGHGSAPWITDPLGRYHIDMARQSVAEALKGVEPALGSISACGG